MAELKVKVEGDFTETDEEGRILMKMQELHIHLPTPQDGTAYRVHRLGEVVEIVAEKMEG